MSQSTRGGTASTPAAPFWAYYYGEFTFPLATLSVDETSQGLTLDSFALANVAATSSWSNASGHGSCADGYQNYTWYEVCSNSWTTGIASQTSIYVSHYSGDVTYHSQGFCNAGNPNVYCSAIPPATLQSGFWTWNQSSTDSTGDGQRLGVDYGVALQLSDGAKRMEVSPTVQLLPAGYDYGWPYTCSTSSSWWAAHDGGRYCSEAGFVMSGRQGTLSSQ